MVHVTRGLVGVTFGQHLPASWHEGATVRGRLFLLHILPAWVQEICITRLDNPGRELQTTERGGLLRTWNHTIRVEAATAKQCRYSDRVEIKAGVWTPLVWPVAHAFFRYRQWRLRHLLHQTKRGA
jgi:hypothetical protein